MNGPKGSKRGWNAEEKKEERKEEQKESNLDANRQCFHFAVNLDAAVKNRYNV